MIAARVATAAVAGPAFLFVLWLGGAYWAGLWALLAAVGAWEYAAMLRRAGHAVSLAGLWAFIGFTAWAGFGGGLAAATAPAPMLGLALTSAVLAVVSRRYTVIGAALTLHGAVYLGWLPAHLVALRGLGFPPALALFVAIWAADTAAYFGGRAWGRRRLAPAVSPAKTWEGTIAGFAGAATAAAIAAGPAGWLNPGAAVAVALAAGVVGPLGDLYESAWKRQCGVKDAGAVLPGHGGVLDRFDSALWAAPVTYYALLWLA